jgi:ribosomal protein S18 acetylase RimI-like enzyme
MTDPRPLDDAQAALKDGKDHQEIEVRVRRIHRRDLNRVWEFLKLVFRSVNRETVEYQRPRSKRRFLEVYEEEGVEQHVFEITREDKDEVVGYAECAFEIAGTDNWMNERYFEKREMRPLYVEELAVHPDYQGSGIGRFVLEQIEHLARIRGCTHLVLEVAENNEGALRFYRARNFYKLDSAIFMAKRVQVEAELLPPRKLRKRASSASDQRRSRKRTVTPPAPANAADDDAPQADAVATRPKSDRPSGKIKVPRH